MECTRGSTDSAVIQLAEGTNPFGDGDDNAGLSARHTLRITVSSLAGGEPNSHDG